MSNLKEYVVVEAFEGFEIWTNAEYESYTAETLFVGACPAYRIITSFNADQSLADDKELTEAVDILKALVALKKHKDAVGKDEYYEKAQPEVWKIANKFLDNLEKKNV